jgi:RNA-directed DNA polymerase
MNAAEECIDLESISRFLGFAPQHIFYLVENPECFYVKAEIPKNSDKTLMRVLDIPTLELKGVQKAILKNIISSEPISDNVHSYVKGKSILSATKLFCPGRAVLKIDIKDFFPSITFRRIFGLFNSLGFNDTSAFILTRLTTYNNHLAQGAPTSPTLSNLIFRKLDARLEKLVESWEMKYVRYSDDLFFHHEKNFNHERLSELVNAIIDHNGFEANVSKQNYHPKGKPRITLGLLTHGEKPRIPGPERKRYRALFFQASRDVHWAHENQERLKGLLEWYKCVHGKDDNYSQYNAILNNIAKLRFHDTYRSR